MSNAILTTFRPVDGPWAGAGTTYQIPDIKAGTYQAVPHINRQQNVHRSLQFMHGSYLASGKSQMYMDYAEITATFFFTPNTLIARPEGYTGNYAGLRSALYDFYTWVVMGGLGILTGNEPAGTMFDGFSITSWTTSAVVNGDPMPDLQPGQTVVEWPVTFLCPTGFKTTSAGDLVYIF